jgi:hypothetical protein
MYAAGNIGEVRVGRCVGPTELIKYYSGQECEMLALIGSAKPLQQDARTTYMGTSAPVSAFSVCTISLPLIEPYEIDVLKRLSSKIVPKGYLAE